MLIPLLLNLGFAGGGATQAAETPQLPPQAKGHGKGGKPKQPRFRYIVEVGGEQNYFWSEYEARQFLDRIGKKVKRQAKAIARKRHKITLPAGSEPLPLPEIQPLPRFIVTGDAAIEAMAQRINAQLDAILMSEERDAEIDDEDLMRLLQ